MRDLCLVVSLALLSIDCDGEDLPAARPVEVEVFNQIGSSLYLAGDRLSFRVRDAEGQEWSPDSALWPLCSDCDDACDGDIHGDPVPMWIELLAGTSIRLDWEGRLYRRSACGCGETCVEPAYLENGEYDLVLEFELALPEAWAPYDSVDVGDGFRHWQGSGFGTADPQQTRTTPFTFDGQTPIDVIVLE